MCHVIPCESIKSYNMLFVVLTDCLSLLQLGMASDSYTAGLESHVLSALLSKEHMLLCLDDFEAPWDQPRHGGR